MVHDRERMPRLKAALQGVPVGRDWDESKQLLALIWQQLQILVRVGWVGRIEGDPPKFVEYPTPKPNTGEPETAEAPRKPDERIMSYLDRFSPPKRHLKIVEGESESA